MLLEREPAGRAPGERRVARPAAPERAARLAPAMALAGPALSPAVRVAADGRWGARAVAGARPAAQIPADVRSAVRAVADAWQGVPVAADAPPGAPAARHLAQHAVPARCQALARGRQAFRAAAAAHGISEEPPALPALSGLPALSRGRALGPLSAPHHGSVAGPPVAAGVPDPRRPGDAPVPDGLDRRGDGAGHRPRARRQPRAEQCREAPEPA